MRKLTIVLAAAALAVTSTGCVGRCKNWFHKGSPCGTVMTTPAMLSGPVAMGAPLGGPIMQPNMCCEQAPMCVPCDPCMQYDPCATTGAGMTSGYFGGYMPQSSDCGCAQGGVTMSAPTTVTPGTLYPAPSVQ